MCASQAVAAAGAAQCSPLYPAGNVMNAQRRISDPWVGGDLSSSPSPITLLAGAWTSKALGKGNSRSELSMALKMKLSTATLRDWHRVAIKFQKPKGLGEASVVQGRGPCWWQVKQTSTLSQRPLQQVPASRSG